jgi:hypothetical protein
MAGLGDGTCSGKGAGAGADLIGSGGAAYFCCADDCCPAGSSLLPAQPISACRDFDTVETWKRKLDRNNTNRL